MVWGMERVGSGIYGPYGSFPGQQERLEAIERQMTAGEKAEYGSLGYEAFVNESIHKDNGPLPEQVLPRRFVAQQRYNTLGSLLVIARGVRAVDENLKNIIERLEPGVHQFWPLQIIMPNGDEYPVQYYGMMVLRHLSSFRPEQSDSGCFFGEEIAPGIRSYTVLGVSKEKYAGLAMSKATFGSTHVWRERELTDPTLLLSDELFVEIKKAGLKIPKHFQLKAV